MILILKFQKIKNFWDGSQLAYTSNTKSNTLPNRADYAYLMPSCSMTNFYAAPGVTLSVNFSIPTTTVITVSTTTSISTTNPSKSFSNVIGLTKILSFIQVLVISKNF